MSAVLEIFARDSWTHLAQALLHTLWQGALVAAVLYVVLKNTASNRVGFRYGVSVAGLALVVFAAGLTWAVLDYESNGVVYRESSVARGMTVQPEENGSSVVSVTPTDNANQTAPANAPVQTKSLAADEKAGGFAEWTPWLVAAWLGGVALMLLRAVLSIIGAGRLRNTCRPLEDKVVKDLAVQLQLSLRIGRRVCIAISDRINVPAVLGAFWPTILLPASAMTGLPPDHLRAILAHELAHIRRHDYLVNLAQMLIEALLFFNPAVWWISRQVRNEREAGCDALAAELTGEAGQYVNVLLEVATRAYGQTGLPQAAPAMAESDRPGSLTDRAHRLLKREHRAIPRLGWRGMVTFLILGGLGLAVLCSGAFMTVSAAARLLQHEKRAKRFVELQDTHGQYPPSVYGTRENDKPLTLTGSVATWDGRTPDGGQALIHINHKGGMISARSRELSWRPDRALDLNCQEGDEIYFAAVAPGYAPAFMGPVTADADAEKQPLKLVLGAGYSALLKVVDGEGRPVAGARVKGGYDFPASHASSRKVPFIETITSEQGEVTVDHASTYPVHLAVSARGFQFKRKAFVEFEKGQAVEIQLKPTTPARGIVVARETGKPIAGATVRLISEQGPTEGMFLDPVRDGSMSWSGHGVMEQTLLVDDTRTTADESGRFVLSSLRTDSVYQLMVDADGYAPNFLRNVTAGSDDLKIELGPELYISGIVKGDVSRLTGAGKYGDRPEIEYLVEYKRDDNVTPHRIQRWQTLEERDGEWRFEIRDLWEGHVWLEAAHVRRGFDVTKPITDVVLDLGTENEKPNWETYPMRPVVLRFLTPKDAPPPTGEVGVEVSVIKGKRGYIQWRKQLPIEDGEVRFEAPAPGRAYLERAREVAGFWFDMQLHEVPAGSTTHTIDVETIPAGAIYGRYVEADGSPAEGANALIYRAKKSRLDRGFYWGVPARHDEGDGKFMIGPVPLEWTYVIKARRGNYLLFSKPYQLQPDKPFKELDFRFDDGETVGGRVVGPSGEPVKFASVSFEHWLDKHQHTLETVRTGEDGRFAFVGVNPRVPGNYSVKVFGVDGLQSCAVDLKNFHKPVMVRLEEE